MEPRTPTVEMRIYLAYTGKDKGTIWYSVEGLYFRFLNQSKIYRRVPVLQLDSHIEHGGYDFGMLKVNADDGCTDLFVKDAEFELLALGDEVLATGSIYEVIMIWD